jgi:Homeodomain-like domain
VRRTGASKPTVILWKKRYAAEGAGGLEDRPKPGKPRVIDDVAIVLATLEPPPKRLGVTHWSSRLLAAELGISNVKVADVWREWGCSRGGPRASSSHKERSRLSSRQRPEFLAWILDDAGEQDAAAVLTEMPPPARLVYRRVLRPRYDAQHRWQIPSPAAKP